MFRPVNPSFLRSYCAWIIWACISSYSLRLVAAAVQEVIMLNPAELHDKWHVVLSEGWDVLGPFPIQAREQHFLSPSYPLSASSRLVVDSSVTYPSAYADGGLVGWSKARCVNETLEVSFPNIRWEQLRASEGWAALQHHTLLHAQLTVYPPRSVSTKAPVATDVPQRLLVDIQQASFFAIQSSQDDQASQAESGPLKWHSGNIYALTASPPHMLPLPTVPSVTSPTTYDLFVSGDYEIRLFGDPAVSGTGVPKLSIAVNIQLDLDPAGFTVLADHNVIPDFVDGWAFGSAIGIGIRSSSDCWTVSDIKLADESKEIDLSLLRTTRLAPTQTRIVPVHLHQSEPFYGEELKATLSILNKATQEEVEVSVAIPVKQLPAWTASNFSPIISTYFFASQMPTAFVAVPPKESTHEPELPLLFLHGAGLDVLTMSFWHCAPPRQERSWLILPTGRTAWGLDWHGPSTADAWQSVSALASILQTNVHWKRWSFSLDTKVLLLGHSNGGQGAWHVAERYPDRVVAVVPAAAYSKSQSYIPLVQSRSGHFVDPFLRAILESSLTPDDNDLFVTNSVDTPIMAVHGGDDDNVPVWHTRALLDTLKTWRSDANITFKEDPGQLHCYPTILNNAAVQDFIDSSLASESATRKSNTFTLTVAVPSESGSLHGWKVISLENPGRLARLTVHEEDKFIRVTARNVRTFTVDMEEKWLAKPLRIEEQDDIALLSSPEASSAAFTNQDGVWKEIPQIPPIQPSGRIVNILSTAGPLTLVIADDSTDASFSAAARLAHDLDVYHKLDATIMPASEAQQQLTSGTLGAGNVVVLGNGNNSFLSTLLGEGRTPFRLEGGWLTLRGRPIKQTSCAVFLHPHPTSPLGLTLFMYSESAEGLERATRLFPLRTGLALPDWIVVGEAADSMGMGGVEAAGVWGNDWSWNGGMSSF